MVEDRRAVRTRRALHRALITLILRKGYEATTVQDIIDEADVGRSTFYAHYTGKQDLLRSSFVTLQRKLEEEQRKSPERTSGSLAFNPALFEHAYDYKEVYRALIGGRGGIVAVSELRRILSELARRDLSVGQFSEDIPKELRVQFIVGTFLSVLSWSLERKPSLPPHRMNTVFRELVAGGLGASSLADRAALSAQARHDSVSMT